MKNGFTLRKLGEEALLGISLLFAIIIAVASLDMDVVSAGPGLAPLLWAGGLGIVALFRIWQVLRDANASEETIHEVESPEMTQNSQMLRPVLIVAICAAFIFSLTFTSYYLAAGIFMAALCLVLGQRSPKVVTAMVVFWLAFVFGAFETLLKLDLPTWTNY